jgi:hypothetical protein
VSFVFDLSCDPGATPKREAFQASGWRSPEAFARRARFVESDADPIAAIDEVEADQ